MTTQQHQIQTTLNRLYKDSKYDRLKILRGAARSIFGPIQPADFKNVYLSISKTQGEFLVRLIKENNLKNIVEFGTSFGISTLFLAEGVIATGGRIITTELIESKAKKAVENFKAAGVANLIEVRTGDALKSLKSHREPIDLLLLDGWKNLYLPLFRMLEENFHANTVIYVDNADMADSRAFLKAVRQDNRYRLVTEFGGEVVLITLNH